MIAPQFTDDHHILFIDQQASFDLAVACLQEGHTWEALREAIHRAAQFLGHPFMHHGPVRGSGITLT